MRAKRAVIAIIVLLVLGAGAWYATRPSTTSASERVLTITPSEITGLLLTRAQDTERIVRAGDRWMVETGESRWAAGDTRVRGALRALSELTGERGDEGSVEPDAPTLTIERADAPLRLRLSRNRLGGRGFLQVEEGDTWLVDGALLDVFTETGLGAWREDRLFAAADPSRYRISTPEREVALSRVQGRWGVTHPIGSRADAERMKQLRALLGNVRAVEFHDDLGRDDPILGLDTPTSTIIAESDRLDAGTGERYTERLTLVTGAPGDVGGTSVFAYAEHAEVRRGEAVVLAKAVVTIPRDALAGVAVDPAWYASRRVLGIPAADVASVALRRVPEPTPAPIDPSPAFEPELVLTRTIDGWRTESGSDTGDIADHAELLRLLCGTDADEVTTQLPEGYEASYLVQIEDLAGNIPGAAEIGAAGEDRLVRTGALVYRFAAPSEPAQKQ